jgi:hypothetical protein
MVQTLEKVLILISFYLKTHVYRHLYIPTRRQAGENQSDRQ